MTEEHAKVEQTSDTTCSDSKRLVGRFCAAFGNGPQNKQLRVKHARSGRVYVLEQAAYDSCKTQARPYVYVWREKGQNTNRPVWCYLESLIPVGRV